MTKIFLIRTHLHFFTRVSSVVTLLVTLSIGSTSQAGCFKDHIRHAVEGNTARLEQYKKLNNPQAVEVLESLIFQERLSLFLQVGGTEIIASSYEKAGIPLLCEGFVPVVYKSPVVNTPMESFDPKLFVKVDAETLNKKISQAIKLRSFYHLEEAVTEELKKMNFAKTNCLLRHTLESIRRFAQLGPKHRALANTKGFTFADDVTWQVIRLHTLAVDYAIDLDQRALVPQSQGIPVICSEMPHIPEKI